MDIRVNTTTNRPYTGVCVCVYRVAFIRLQHCSTAWCHVYKYYSIYYYHSSSSILCIVRRLAMLKVRCISTDYIGTVCSVPPRRLLFYTVRPGGTSSSYVYTVYVVYHLVQWIIAHHWFVRTSIIGLHDFLLVRASSADPTVLYS